MHCYDLPSKDAETIFEFQLNECLVINRRSFIEGDCKLEKNRDTIGAFILFAPRMVLNTFRPGVQSFPDTFIRSDTETRSWALAGYSQSS